MAERRPLRRPDRPDMGRQIGPEARETNEFLDRLESEGREGRKDLEKNWEDDIKFAHGEQWREKPDPYQSTFTLNMADLLVNRNVALLTDTKPTIKILPRQASQEYKDAAEMLENVISALWDERSVTQRLDRMLQWAAYIGFSGLSLPYNPDLDHGLGDIDFRVDDPRYIFWDPNVMDVEHFGEDSEWVWYEGAQPLDAVRNRYNIDSDLLKPDEDISSFESKQRMGRRGLGGLVRTPIQRWGSRSRDMVASAIPRVWVQEFYVKDRVMQKALTEGDTPGPIWRRMVRVGKASKFIAVDEPSIYWDQQVPTEIYNWRIDVENSMGMSEIQALRMLQEHLNKVGATITDDALLMQNGVWVGDADALSPEEWDNLTNEPGLLVKKVPGRELRRDYPQGLAPGVIQFMNLIQNAMDTVSGLSDVTQGEAGEAKSGIAIESLQLASQVLVRRRARQLEAFMMRAFNRVISRIFQFFTEDRLFHLLGPGQQTESFKFERGRLRDLTKGKSAAEAWRDFRFWVQPGSSLGVTVVQRSVLAQSLFQLGVIDRESLLEAVEWPNREIVTQRLQEEEQRQLMMQQQAAMAAAGGGGGAPAAANGNGAARGGQARSPATGRSPQAFPAGTGGSQNAAFNR